MLTADFQKDQAKKTIYSKPLVTELNSQATAGGAAGVQERLADSMNPNRKDLGTS
jgi:hypothetical protein